jgi:hypothetical protein
MIHHHDRDIVPHRVDPAACDALQSTPVFFERQLGIGFVGIARLSDADRAAEKGEDSKERASRD